MDFLNFFHILSLTNHSNFVWCMLNLQKARKLWSWIGGQEAQIKSTTGSALSLLKRGAFQEPLEWPSHFLVLRLVGKENVTSLLICTVLIGLVLFKGTLFMQRWSPRLDQMCRHLCSTWWWGRGNWAVIANLVVRWEHDQKCTTYINHVHTGYIYIDSSKLKGYRKSSC